MFYTRKINIFEKCYLITKMGNFAEIAIKIHQETFQSKNQNISGTHTGILSQISVYQI